MKRYVYPSVVYSDPETESFMVFFPDLGIVADGNTAEESYNKAKAMLKEYFTFANKYSSYAPDPTPFDKVQKQNPNKQVLLIDTEIEDKKVTLSDADKQYIEFMKMFFDED